MARDVVTLGIEVDASGAVTSLGRVDSGFDKVAATAQKAGVQIQQVTLSAGQYRRLQNEITTTTHQLELMIAATDKHDREAVTGLKQLIEEQTAWARSVGASTDQLLKLQAVQNRFEKATDTAEKGVKKLATGFEQLTTELVGANPVIGRMTAGLAELGIGTAATAGILLGLAAIAKGYELMTEESRKAKKDADDLTQSLLAASKAAYDSTITGKIIRANRAEATAYLAAQTLQETEEATHSRDPGRRLPALFRLKQAQQDADDTARAAGQAQLEVIFAQDDAKKKQAEDDKRRHAEEMARIRERAALLKSIDAPDLSAVLGNIANRLNPDGTGITVGAAGGVPLTTDVNKIPIPGVGMSLDQLREVFKQADDIRTRNRDQRLKEEQDDKRAAEKYAADTRAIWRQGIGKIITDGTKSFRDFFEDVAQLFSRLMARMEQEGKTNTFAYKALGAGSAAIAGGFAGYQIGQQQANAGGGAVGGATMGALAGFEIAGPMGAVVGGLAGFATGLIGGAEAARQHAEALRNAQKTFVNSMAVLRAQAGGTDASGEQGLAAIEQDRQSLIAANRIANPIDFNHFAESLKRQIDAIKEVNDLEDKRVELLKKEIATQKQQFKEDLQVRLLRAEGHNKEADALALQLQQQREYDAAVKAGADAATLALLLQVQAAEKVKEALGGLETAVRNAPSGFKVERYINEFAAARTMPGNTYGWEGGIGRVPTPIGNARAVTYNFSGATFKIDAKDKTAKEAFQEWSQEFTREKSTTVGPNASSSAALEYFTA